MTSDINWLFYDIYVVCAFSVGLSQNRYLNRVQQTRIECTLFYYEVA